MQTLARWSTTHRRIVVALWLVLLVDSIGPASGLENRFVDGPTRPNGPERRDPVLGALVVLGIAVTVALILADTGRRGLRPEPLRRKPPSEHDPDRRSY